MSFWSNAKANRIKQDISQKDIADKLSSLLGEKWSQPRYVFYEKEKAVNTPKPLKEAIATILGVPLTELEKEPDSVLGKFPLPIQQWIATPDADNYILAAFSKYLQDTMKKPPK